VTRLLRINHAGVTVSDIDRSLRFYRDLLGLEVVRDFTTTRREQQLLVASPDALTCRLVFLAVPGRPDVQVELFHAEPALEPIADLDTRRAGSVHICFDVADLWSTYRELTGRGVEFVHQPVALSDTGGWIAYCMDPDGTRIEFIEWPGTTP
jgi:catechol 2,3-dioxygenase-like lactoylglutathione lyase family enzyme